MIKKLILFTLSISLTSLSFMIQAAGDTTGGDPVAGKSAAIICIGCHSVDGNSTNPIYPKLAGQGEAYLAKQLLDFKSSKRKEEHMTSMVEAISEKDIPNIAAFFSRQTRNTNSKTKNKYPLGQNIYLNGIVNKGVIACVSCHGKQAEGKTEIKYPALAGQHADYIVKSLKEFRAATRDNDAGQLMRNNAKPLSDAEITALANYLSTL